MTRLPFPTPVPGGGGLGVVWVPPGGEGGVCGRVVLTEVGMLGCFISGGCV